MIAKRSRKMCVKTLRESKFKRKSLNSESDTVLEKKEKMISLIQKESLLEFEAWVSLRVTTTTPNLKPSQI